MKKVQLNKSLIYLLALMSLTSLALVSCGGGSDDSATATEKTATTGTEETTSTEDAEPYFLNEDLLAKAQEELQNLETYKGQDIKVFQEYTVDKNSITIQLQDPNNPENIDELVYEDGAWSEPEPLQIMGDGDMSSNVFSLTEMPFTGVVQVAKTWQQEAEKMEDEVTSELSFVDGEIDIMNGALRWSASNMSTKRAQYNLAFKQDGTLENIEKL